MKTRQSETQQQSAAAANSTTKISSRSLVTPATILLPDPNRSIVDQDAIVLFAMCIFGEARGESDIARRAVAQVVLNRARNPRALFGSRKAASFDENLRCVILQPQQFSSLNPYDPNYRALMHPLDEERPEVWERCVRCAQDALDNKDRSDTLTANSDHYFDDSIQPPAWASPAKQTVKVGRLNFYRIYLSAPPRGPAASSSSVNAPQGTPSNAFAPEGNAGERVRPVFRFQPPGENLRIGRPARRNLSTRVSRPPPPHEPSRSEFPTRPHYRPGIIPKV